VEVEEENAEEETVAKVEVVVRGQGDAARQH
jgi:hypothetical protein